MCLNGMRANRADTVQAAPVFSDLSVRTEEYYGISLFKACTQSFLGDKKHKTTYLQVSQLRL